MTPVYQEQFEFISDTEIRHQPTGTLFSSTPFEKPEYAAAKVEIQRGPDLRDAANDDDYCIHELSICAVKMLRG